MTETIQNYLIIHKNKLFQYTFDLMFYLINTGLFAGLHTFM